MIMRNPSPRKSRMLNPYAHHGRTGGNSSDHSNLSGSWDILPDSRRVRKRCAQREPMVPEFLQATVLNI